jgi:hypothetical protein
MLYLRTYFNTLFKFIILKMLQYLYFHYYFTTSSSMKYYSEVFKIVNSEKVVQNKYFNIFHSYIRFRMCEAKQICFKLKFETQISYT